MSKLPLITAKELIKILLAAGFELKRQKEATNFFSIKTEEPQSFQIMERNK